MKNKIKQILISIIVVLLVLVIVIFITDRQSTEISADSISLRKSADIAIDKVQQTAVRDGITEWTLKAVSAKLTDAQKQEAVFEKPAITFFLKDGKTLSMTAKQGIVETDSNSIEAKGKVRLTQETYQLETEQLRYENDKRMFSANVPVSVSGREIHLSADAMSYDINMNQLFFKGNVKGIFSESFSL